MQTDERYNVPKRRKMHYGDDGYIGGDHEYTKPYSDELDHSIGATSLNAHPRLNKKQHKPQTFGSEERGNAGLIFKEPLI